VKLTGGEPMETVLAENECGPACPICTMSMRPVPGHPANIVRCVTNECLWAMAPFKASVAAVNPEPQPDEVAL